MHPEPLNGPLEAGIRLLAVLNAAFPRSYDIADLVTLDYAIVYSADYNGPVSLHPEVPNHRSELAFRREIVELGLQVMIRAGLIEMQPNPEGVFFAATEDAHSFFRLLRSPYSARLAERARWLTGDNGNGLEMRGGS